MVTLKPGQQAALGELPCAWTTLRITQDDQKQMITATSRCSATAGKSAKMCPAHWFFNKRERAGPRRCAIRRWVLLKISTSNMPNYQVKGNRRASR